MAGCLVVCEGIKLCFVSEKFPTEKDSESIYVPRNLEIRAISRLRWAFLKS